MRNQFTISRKTNICNVLCEKVMIRRFIYMYILYKQDVHVVFKMFIFRINEYQAKPYRIRAESNWKMGNTDQVLAHYIRSCMNFSIQWGVNRIRIASLVIRNLSELTMICLDNETLHIC